MASSTNTTLHGVRGYLRFAHIDRLIPADPAAVRIEELRRNLRGHRVLHLVGKGDKPATMPLTEHRARW
jgi:integrase/recombinase XerD